MASRYIICVQHWFSHCCYCSKCIKALKHGFYLWFNIIQNLFKGITNLLRLSAYVFEVCL